MIRWTHLKIFEWSRVKVFKADDPSFDSMATVYDHPLDHFTLPDEATAIQGESFECLTSPERFKNGDVAIVCQDDGLVLGYVWLSFKDLWVSECRLFIKVKENEAVAYDAFVFPKYRTRRVRSKRPPAESGEAGKPVEAIRRIQPAILRMASSIQAEVWRRGRNRVVTYVESHDSNPLKTNQHMGGDYIMSVHSLHLMERFSLHWATDQPFNTRFHR